MALPKKGLRKITVDSFRYAWSATGNDGNINVTIAPLDNVGLLFSTAFGSRSKAVAPLPKPDGSLLGFALKWQLITTPYIIRQIIQYALSWGWNPLVEASQFRIPVSEIEAIIDLRLSDEHR